ncbi:MAG: MarR family winged helix-turn-helix transcriptional regulator [Rhodospirillales bacterium]|nr:MarR family winged helix-turn-helix transcriptional regulator [Rhodospirillales bacterium]
MAPVDPEHVIRLQHFVPYRLAVLAEQISRAVGAVYAERFSLTRPEWRVLAALGEHGEMAGTDIARFSALDKMAVSRAVAALQERGCLTRHDDPRDRRHKRLRLTPRGRALYRRIVPLALARERFLLDALPAQDRAALPRILAALQRRAAELDGLDETAP